MGRIPQVDAIADYGARRHPEPAAAGPAPTVDFFGERARVTLDLRLRQEDAAMQPTSAAPTSGSALPVDFTAFGGTDLAGLRCDGTRGDRLRSLDPGRAALRWFFRGDSSVEELVLQLYFGAFSVAEVDAVMLRLSGGSPCGGLVHEAAEAVVRRLRRWAGRPVDAYYPYLLLHAFDLRQPGPARGRSVRVAVVTGIDARGYRAPLGVATARMGEDPWSPLLLELKRRGLREAGLFAGSDEPVLKAALRRHGGRAALLSPPSELERLLLRRLRGSDYFAAVAQLQSLTAADHRRDAERAARGLAQWLEEAGYTGLAAELDERMPAQLALLDFPRAHWRRVREPRGVRIALGQLREKLRVVAPVSREEAVQLMATAFFRHRWRQEWGRRAYLPAQAGLPRRPLNS